MMFDHQSNPIFLYKSTVNIRQEHEKLTGRVRKVFGESFLLSGAAFVFVSKNRRVCKILYYDGSGLVLIHKRLMIRIFPEAPFLDEVKEITYQDLLLLFDGRPSKIFRGNSLDA